ncbi:MULTISPECIES: GOLPH3/VPS74 family protein [Streptomyces]|uniref:GOLPH3/VPS74 family protein n=1 Tax=Streptomyces TaxID=1883 RepID=UPI002B1E01B3|nr:GPP34 family phosphoprotein [Streptomyces sp. NBC_00160]
MLVRITLAEEIMLLSLDDESGVARQRQSAGWAVAGAILLELVMAERVSVSGKYLELSSTEPTGEELLDGRIGLLETWLRGRTKRRVTDWLTKDQPKAVGAVLARLGERGLVVAQVHKVFGVFPQRRYPEADGTVERALRVRLREVVLAGAEPDERTAGLIALIHSARLHRLAFPGRQPDELTERTAEIAAGQWAAESVRAAILDMHAAMVTVTAVTVLTATT